ncbi:MAG: sigma-70 family RNA polymerase sigma factor, partial [Clostridia bacterium]|nr:sigma-70 family RNA polymerase sigma factor [Clostridia bacterium]
PVDEVVACLEAVQLPSSIYDTLFQDDGDPILLVDHLGQDEADEQFERMAVKEVLQKLPEKYRRVIYLRFYEDKTQAEVAELIGLSQVQVSRLERQALKAMRQLMMPG